MDDRYRDTNTPAPQPQPIKPPVLQRTVPDLKELLTITNETEIGGKFLKTPSGVSFISDTELSYIEQENKRVQVNNQRGNLL